MRQQPASWRIAARLWHDGTEVAKCSKDLCSGTGQHAVISKAWRYVEACNRFQAWQGYQGARRRLSQVKGLQKQLHGRQRAVENLGRSVCRVYVFQPPTSARCNFLHADKEGVPVHNVVGICLVVSEAQAVGVCRITLLRTPLQMGRTSSWPVRLFGFAKAVHWPLQCRAASRKVHGRPRAS